MIVSEVVLLTTWLEFSCKDGAGAIVGAIDCEEGRVGGASELCGMSVMLIIACVSACAGI